MTFELMPRLGGARTWKDDEKRESRLVFIGRELDPERLRKSFEACQAAS